MKSEDRYRVFYTTPVDKVNKLLASSRLSHCLLAMQRVDGQVNCIQGKGRNGAYHNLTAPEISNILIRERVVKE